MRAWSPPEVSMPVARRLTSLFLVLAAACSGGGSTAVPPQRLPDVTTATATYDTPTTAATCPGGTAACGASDFCCPTGTTCVANPNDVYGCGSDVCCVGCTGGGVGCGGGCCASGTSCVANPGGATGCAGNLCCSPTPDPDVCPLDVAATCPGGTTCMKNKSARYCSGGYACYLPEGGVACPGEVMCPDGASFCPSGKFCGTTSGVCPVGSAGAGNYCCMDYAQSGQSCDDVPCAPGLSCVANAYCPDQDQYAASVCKGSCGGSYPVDCGNHCCSSSYPVCGSGCWCWTY